jgi:hypothetical protein
MMDYPALKVVLFLFDSERVRQWWDKSGRSSSSAEWEQFIDELIAEHPPTNTLLQNGPQWAES